jgi:hypothetical protein
METASQITDWISLFVIIGALITSFIYRQRKDLLSIQAYIIASFIFNFIAKIFDYHSKNFSYYHMGEIVLNIFSLLEISLLYYFLFTRIKNHKFRFTIIFFLLAYYSTCIFFWTIKKDSFYAFSPDLFGIESLLLVIPCFFYLYEILNSDLPDNLNSDPNFIITCGILFYFSISAPSYFSWYNLRLMAPGILRILILSNSIFYAILFFSFMKAYICTIPNLKQ